MSKALPALSKSRAPKRDRAPYQPKEELLPDPNDYFRSAAYIDQRAAMSEFKGAPGRETGTVTVLHYLWRHTLRDSSLEGASKGREARGRVLTGKSKLAKIAADTCQSYSTVQRAVDWLIENEWLDYGYRDDQTMIFGVKMTMDGHHDRLSRLGEGVVGQTTGVVTQTTGDEGCGQTDNRVCAEGQHPVVTETPPPGQPAHAIQGDLQGSYKNPNNETLVDLFEGQDQNQRHLAGAGPAAQEPGIADISSGESPSEQRAWLESLRSGAARRVEDPEHKPEDPERVAAFLGYLREHATSPETGVRPYEVWNALGMPEFPLDGDWFIDRLYKERVILPGRPKGWYLVQDDAA